MISFLSLFLFYLLARLPRSISCLATSAPPRLAPGWVILFAQPVSASPRGLSSGRLPSGVEVPERLRKESPSEGRKARTRERGDERAPSISRCRSLLRGASGPAFPPGRSCSSLLARGCRLGRCRLPVAPRASCAVVAASRLLRLVC